MVWFTCVTMFLLSVLVEGAEKKEGDDEWVNLPNKCEVCKFVSIEMKSAFDETGKTKEVIERNYRFLDDNKGAPPIKYVKSDIRFIEVVENVCQRLSGYNLHKEREGSNRFAKGMSETFSTLHGLVHKGVKVVMDIPYELWNETSAEVADLKKQCDVMIEQYEEVIEDWYKGSQEEDLTTYLCENHVLKGQDTGYSPAERGIHLPVSVGKQTEPGSTWFSSRIFPVLSSILFLFILKDSLVLAVYKHTHNMMQPPPCLVKSGIGFASNITLCIQDKKLNFFAKHFAVTLYCTVLQTGCMFRNI